jgi:predicted nucleic acid-binding protein
LRIFFDTSCLVAVLHQAHPAHDVVWSWYARAGQRGAAALTSSHALAETFAVLTVLPVKPRPTPAVVAELIREHLERRLAVQAVSTADVRWAIGRLAELSLSGGRIYDALHARAALRCRAEAVLTLNHRHFAGLDAGLDGRLVDPTAGSGSRSPGP